MLTSKRRVLKKSLSLCYLLGGIKAEICSYILTSYETGVFIGDPGKFWEDYLNIIQERERRLLDLLEGPKTKTMEEMVRSWIIYGQEQQLKSFFESAERTFIKTHRSGIRL